MCRWLDLGMESIKRLNSTKSLKDLTPVESQRIDLTTSSSTGGVEWSFGPHPPTVCHKVPPERPGPGAYYRADLDRQESAKPAFSLGASANDLGGCPVELWHCTHCEKKTKETWTPPVDAKGVNQRPKECATKGCVYLAAPNRAYCCCSCSKVTPAPGYMPPSPQRLAPRRETKTESRGGPKKWPGPGQYDLKSTLDGVDFVKGNSWVKPEKKDKEKEKKDPGPGHFDPRYSAVTRSAPSIGFGSGSRWREIKRLPKREKGPGPAGPGPGEYNQSTLSGNKMKNSTAVTIKGPWPDRGRPNSKPGTPNNATNEEEVVEALAPVGPGPPITTFKSKRS